MLPTLIFIILLLNFNFGLDCYFFSNNLRFLLRLLSWFYSVFLTWSLIVTNFPLRTACIMFQRFWWVVVIIINNPFPFCFGGYCWLKSSTVSRVCGFIEIHSKMLLLMKYFEFLYVHWWYLLLLLRKWLGFCSQVLQRQLFLVITSTFQRCPVSLAIYCPLGLFLPPSLLREEKFQADLHSTWYFGHQV